MVIGVSLLLGRMYSVAGAYSSACTTVDANIWVNTVDIALGDSFYGAFVDASSACNAVFIDFVSHNSNL